MITRKVYVRALKRELNVPAYTVEESLSRAMVLLVCETREQVLAFLSHWKQKDLAKWEAAKAVTKEKGAPDA